MAKTKYSDKEIEDRYRSGLFNLTQERNDFLLPQIIDFVRQKKWMNLHPEYQRRMVWDVPRKSLFIESLLMNIPIPPIFLFEWDYSRYEVMDGQQRLNSIIGFYNNEFRLSGLESWKELNGKNYSECPPVIRRGLDRRRISATIILAESSRGRIDDSQQSMHQMVFERLNTGGMRLNAQELRNCIYSGSFNDMINKLAGNSLFNDIWDVPRYSENIIDGEISQALANNSLFKRMGDCEIVLRFFAFRLRSYVKGSVKSILDNCMLRNRNIDAVERDKLATVFETRLQAAHNVFGDEVFKITDSKSKTQLSAPLFDAVMIAIDRNYMNIESFIERKENIKEQFKVRSRNDQEFYDLVTGKVNTAPSIIQRSEALEQIFLNAIR